MADLGRPISGVSPGFAAYNRPRSLDYRHQCCYSSARVPIGTIHLRTMFDWLTRRQKGGSLPEYAALRADPDCGLPQDLASVEKSAQFGERRARIENELLSPARRPGKDEKLFTEVMGVDGRALCALR